MEGASSSHPSPSQGYAPVHASIAPPSDRHQRHRSSSYNGPPPPPSPGHYRSMPASPYRGLPPPPDRPTSSYYDPTRDERAAAREALVTSKPYRHPSPGSRPPEPPYQMPQVNGHGADSRASSSRRPSQSSPSMASHAHPNAAPPSDSRSPAYDPIRGNGHHSHSTSTESAAAPAAPERANNPMNMANLLSNPAPIPEPAAPLAPPKTRKPPTPSDHAASSKPPSRKASRTSSASQQGARSKDANGDPSQVMAAVPRPPVPSTIPMHSQAPPVVMPPLTGPPSLTVRDTEQAFREINDRDLSDVENDDVPGLETSKREWQQRTHKRALEKEFDEATKRKRRRLKFMYTFHDHFSAAAESDRTVFVDQYEAEVAEEVKLREVEEDKERKKDQQRKRRREKAIADEQQKKDEAEIALATVQDPDERTKIEKEIQRYDKKIRDTQSRLQGITPSRDSFMRNESPHNAAALGRREREVNLDGGLMTSFYTTGQGLPLDEGTPEFSSSRGGRGRSGRGGGGGRARKSKEQKLAEKENARLAQAIIDQGQDLPTIAPKEEERLAAYAERKAAMREDSEPLSEATPAVFDMQPTAGLTGMAKFDSKGYLQIYEQITKGDIAKNIPKVVRIKNNSLDTKQSNARKTAQLAAKEARRWQLKTNKSQKDVAARAKRAMREMLGFWKRNERDEREGRKVAERQELDKAKKQEAEREANRQKRKLNFLISQTELYSHFIRKKVKTDDYEDDGEGVTASKKTVEDDPNAKHIVDLPDSVANLGKKVTNFEDLDFDAEDETALQEAAMANAQNALKEAQDKARAFNKPDKSDEEDGEDLATAQANFDEGEMNFQNPTSLQTMDVSQPKMLSCQLKEYQLKGLNWLVNLYEQGINGILADEMGLGKTVQSISVMAYLAEMHDIWGPFLVIAPASTLHNWQQEIAKFVPTLKVLPYWGSAKDRKVLRKFWDRKHITYNRDSPFHVLVTSYQLVVQDTAYFQKVKWQYMILDEAQAIKSSQSSRWKSLLNFHCRNRLLLTGTPIQNNMQELWALLHFIMPSLFDNHDEFSEWFSKDIESHAQSNSKLNEDQLKRLHMILKPFMLRRIKKHVQKELGDKIEEDVFCDLTYRQRAYYTNLRNKISLMDLIEKAAGGDDQDTATLMNLVMQFRKVCNHPDLFERADTVSPLAISYYAETASFMREGHSVNVAYGVRNMIDYWLPTFVGDGPGRLDIAGPENQQAGWRNKWLTNELSVWNEQHIRSSQIGSQSFSWLRFVDQSATEVVLTARRSLIERVVELAKEDDRSSKLQVAYDDDDENKENHGWTPVHDMLNIVQRNARRASTKVTNDGHLSKLFNISQIATEEKGYSVIEPGYLPKANAPPIELVCASQRAQAEQETAFFNVPARRALYPIDYNTERALLQAKLPASKYPVTNLLPRPENEKQRYTKIQVPSMRRFVTDSGKLAKLDQLLRQLKAGGHRVLLYFQMTRMIDLMEEYLTYRNYKYCRLDGSTKLEDRRDTVAAFQSDPSIFIFLLSTRAGGLGINLVAADTVIFYDSDWNPTIDSQAMDRAHRLGQTRQVTVYRLITRNTIEERIRKRALQKEEVQRVVITGQAGQGVDFTNRPKETSRSKEMAMWLADDDEAEQIERREAELADEDAKTGGKRKRKNAKKGGKEVSMDDMYHEGEGKFDDGPSHEPSGAATPITGDEPPAKKRKGTSKKAKTVKQRLAVVDGEV
ncbi:Putative helicase, DBINO domain, P-loop containing nucleoside triphosphate hydrolase [Septoria linicola]|uniref:Chromatin-remodeling ATPase INO80 n=1 Tax=Septoria linicola TaxID=215465 RepID=A0A9Q9AKD4_9PEZI|nr:Putative helicase, DBINO domain, P-loop containing nucleoside triphosphate hydrolase [Septoria linicola]